MQRTSLQDFFNTLKSAYAAADFDLISSFYTYPCVVYIEDEVFVFMNRAKLKAALRSQCQAHFRQGARQATVRVVAQGLRAGHGYSVWVEWTLRDGGGHPNLTLDAQYFCRDTADGVPCIHLVEFAEMPVSYANEPAIMQANRLVSA